MPKRFTVDLARIKLNQRGDRIAPATSSLDTSSTPKSIRSLPLELETDLRHACALIVNDDTPVAQKQPTGKRKQWGPTVIDGQRAPELQRPRPGLDSHPVRPIETHGPLQHVSKRDQGREGHDVAPTCPPPTKTFDVAATRVDEVMSGGQEDAVTPTHSRTKSASTHLLVAAPKGASRPSMLPRGSSMDTTHSACHSDITSDENVPSTAITSAVITPGRASKRASAHGVQEKVSYKPDSPNLDEMKRKLEAHRQAREEECHKHSAILHKLTMPARKPVGSSKNTAGGVEDLSNARAEQAPQHPTASQQALRTEPERRGRSTTRARAASGARSLTRGVKEFLRSSSRHAQRERQDNPTSETRPFSSRNAESTEASRTAWLKRSWRTSVDSLLPANTAALTSDEAIPPRLVSAKKSSLQSPGNARRPQSATSVSVPIKTRASSIFGTPQRSTSDNAVIDLNRQLPPLPTLDSWRDHHQGEQDGLGEIGNVSDPSDASRCTPSDTTPTSFAEDGADRGRSAKRKERDVHESVSPVSTTSNPATRVVSSASPRPEMSATFCPGDFDVYGPMRPPSPISESSIKGFALRTRAEKPNLRTIEVEVPSVDDGNSPESPKAAGMITRLSSDNLRAQFVNSATSNISRRPLTSKPLVPSLDARPLPHLPSPTQMPIVSGGNAGSPQLDMETDMSRSEYDGRRAGQGGEGANAKPMILLHKMVKKPWWKPAGKGKQHDWMSDVEQSGSRSGVMTMDEVAAAPIVRY